MKDIIKELQAALGESKVLLDEAVKERYSHIWRMDERLVAKAVILPTSTEDVSKVMQICNQYGQKVVVHGGLTNLVGSTETNEEEIVIAMERMNAIEEVDASSRAITVQAGVVLEHVLGAAVEKGLLFPLSFGAKGSAQIGGVIATNAGGLKVFRYGMTRNLVLGLEVVLADGTIISSIKKIIKDNSAYDLKQLFVGAEGTLGVVTKAVLKLVEAPTSRTSAFVGIDGFENVVALLKYMDAGLAGTLSSFELIWGDTYKAMTSPPTQAKPPVPHGFEYYVLLEGLGSSQTRDQERLEELMAEAMEKGLISDGALAYGEADLEWFWRIREDVHAIASQARHDHHFDISLPIPLIGRVLADIVAQLKAIPEVEVVFTFGHIADGNIHLIIGKANASKALKKQIDMVVYGPLKGIGGSVSAEHGIGIDKKDYLTLCRTDAEIALMKTMKKTLDPKGVLNRGRVFDL